jgi:hypothetical protein
MTWLNQPHGIGRSNRPVPPQDAATGPADTVALRARDEAHPLTGRVWSVAGLMTLERENLNC